MLSWNVGLEGGEEKGKVPFLPCVRETRLVFMYCSPWGFMKLSGLDSLVARAFIVMQMCKQKERQTAGLSLLSFLGQFRAWHLLRI